jgi:hypothetical protein
LTALLLEARPGRVYTDQWGRVTGMASLEPEPNRDQVTQAITVGICLTLAAVLVVLVLV